MSGLRIAMVVPDFPRVGGYERQAIALSLQLRSMGHSPYLVTNARPGKHYATGPEGLELVVLTERPRFREHPFLFIRAFLHHLRQHRVDIVHAHAMAPFSSASLVAAQSHGIPGILKLAGVGDAQAFRSSNDLNFRLARRGPVVATRTIALCEPMEDVALGFGATQTSIARIPNGVDMQYLARVSADASQSLRQDLGIPEPHWVILYVGRLAPEKGPLHLLRSMGPVLEQRDDITLCYVGDGPERAALEAMAGESGWGPRIVFAGFQEDPRPFYQMADVFALPSKEEGMSNALLEAMAFGLAVVATDVGAAREMVGDCGEVVESQNEHALRAALEGQLHLLDSNTFSGKAIQKRCAEHYSMDAVGRQYCNLYEELMQAADSPGMPASFIALRHAMGAMLSP